MATACAPWTLSAVRLSPGQPQSHTHAGRRKRERLLGWRLPPQGGRRRCPHIMQPTTCPVVDFLRGTPPYVAGPEPFGFRFGDCVHAQYDECRAWLLQSHRQRATSLCCAATRVAPRGAGTLPPRLAFLAHRKLPMEEIYETYFDRCAASSQSKRRRDQNTFHKLPMEEIYETYFDRDDACFGY